MTLNREAYDHLKLDKGARKHHWQSFGMWTERSQILNIRCMHMITSDTVKMIKNTYTACNCT